MKPPAEDLARRRPVWEAMSELFLDNELDEADRRRIADVLAVSGYAAEELDAILQREVGPVLEANLRQPAGEWAGFDMKLVEDRILNPPAGMLQRWRSAFSGAGLVNDEWQRIRRLIASKSD